jgi:hypothetical protein
MSVFGLELVLGGLVGPHDDRFGVEKDGNADDVSHALVKLSKTEVAVAINVHAVPDFSPCSSLSLTCAIGKLFSKFLPDFVALHLKINSKVLNFVSI